MSVRSEATDISTLGNSDNEDNGGGGITSMMIGNERAKALFPWLRSYMCRRRLQYAAVASVFIIVGALVSLDMMEEDGHFFAGGKLNHNCSENTLFWVGGRDVVCIWYHICNFGLIHSELHYKFIVLGLCIIILLLLTLTWMDKVGMASGLRKQNVTINQRMCHCFMQQ